MLRRLGEGGMEQGDAVLRVFGLSGQLGEALRRLGLPGPVQAWSRRPPGAGAAARDLAAGIHWQAGDLGSLVLPPSDLPVLSLGPLDAFAAAVAEGRIDAPRLIAFGSTSRHAKASSPDPRERILADRLARAEELLFEAAARRGSLVFLLRPTLVWGMGRDATLSRVVARARRQPRLPLPLDAPGRRQPVHALDLAALALRLLRAPASVAGAYDLPGGETLAFGEMLGRVLRAGAPGARPLPLPWWLLRPGALLPGPWRGPLSRLARDLVFDDTPARALLGWSPRGFQPVPADFPERPEAPV